MNTEKEDPIKLHKQGNLLFETGKYKEAAEKFVESSELYEKRGNFFDASNMLFKAGECSFVLKDFETAIKLFNKSAEISLQKGYDRFAVSALEYALDSYKGMKKEKGKEAIKLKQKIEKIKEKLAAQRF